MAAAISANFAWIESRFDPPQWRGSSTGHESHTASWADHSAGMRNPSAAADMRECCIGIGHLIQSGIYRLLINLKTEVETTKHTKFHERRGISCRTLFRHFESFIRGFLSVK
jgi:hypothetical protein